MSAPRFLSQKEAIELDQELMSDSVGFSNEQLMELAGLASAEVVIHAFPHAKRVLVLVGPGNNGGDGLVAARHLFHFGVAVTLHIPKVKDERHLNRLRRQCDSLGIVVVPELAPVDQWPTLFDVIVDAVFGFSFDPTNGIRAPFDRLIAQVNQSTVPVVALDIPSGWHVDTGNALGVGMRADVLVSLTSPKSCALHFRGRHYVGGRFVPPSVDQAHKLGLASLYKGTSSFALLPPSQ
jgi:NAD(P)H-hydrate epimerase